MNRRLHGPVFLHCVPDTPRRTPSEMEHPSTQPFAHANESDAARAYLDSGITHELRSHRHLHELLNSKITKDLVTQTQDHTTPRDSKLKISTQDLESRVRTQELPPPASSASSLSSSSPSPPLPRKSWKYLALMASQLGLNAFFCSRPRRGWQGSPGRCSGQ
jgi:hypothetical protein